MPARIHPLKEPAVRRIVKLLDDEIRALARNIKVAPIASDLIAAQEHVDEARLQRELGRLLRPRLPSPACRHVQNSIVRRRDSEPAGQMAFDKRAPVPLFVDLPATPGIRVASGDSHCERK